MRLEFDALPEVMEAEGVDPARFEGRQTRYMPAQVRRYTNIRVRRMRAS